MDSIDKLLAEIKAENQKSEPAQPKKQQSRSKPESSLNSLLNQLEAEPQPVKQQQILKAQKNEAPLNSLLNELKADYEALSRAEKQLRQEQLKAQERRKQQLKQQELEVLQQRAIAWLKKLDPLSTEGLWFEKFAENYDSKLEAAIVYLQDLQENNY